MIGDNDALSPDHPAGYDRIGALYRVLSTRWPAGLTDIDRDRMAAQLADLEANTAASLALFLQGQGGSAHELLADHPASVGVPLAASFAAAAEALLAVLGDRAHERGHLAVEALQTRSAEFRAAHERLVARHAGSNAR